MRLLESVDVVVVGSGNAASCAALAAGSRFSGADGGRRRSRDDRGGNTAYAGGQMRVAFEGSTISPR